MSVVARHCGIIALLLLAASAHAAPFTVSSPTAATRPKIKVGMELKDTPAKDTWSAPGLEFAMPVATGLSVTVKGHLRSVARMGGTSETGIGDLELKGKWNFRRAGAGQLGLAIEPKLFLPTGSHRRGLGDGRVGVALPLIAGLKRGPWELGAEIGYEHVFGAADHKVYGGVLAMRRVAGNLRLGSELVVESRNLDTDRIDTLANIGFKLGIGRNSELQGLAGQSIHTADQQRTRKLKLAYEIRW